MQLVFMYVLIGICFLIFVQDLRKRAVHWYLFPSLAFCAFFYGWTQTTVADWTANILFILFLLCSLTLCLSLKEKQFINITRGFFCWGDILFLLAIVPCFDLINYMFFFTVGTSVSLLIHLAMLYFRADQTVPYAGYMSLLFIFYVLVGSSFHLTNLYSL